MGMLDFLKRKNGKTWMGGRKKTEPPAAEAEVQKAVEPGKPAEPEKPPAAPEADDSVFSFKKGAKKAEQAPAEEKEDSKIDAIPLTDQDQKRLRSSGYEKRSQEFPQTYVLQLDVPNPRDPSRTIRRIAEIKAASSLHACTMLGWRPRYVKVISVTGHDPKPIDVQINGSVVLTSEVRGDIPELTAEEKQAEAYRVENRLRKSKDVKRAIAGRKIVKVVTDGEFKHVNFVVKDPPPPPEPPPEPASAATEAVPQAENSEQDQQEQTAQEPAQESAAAENVASEAQPQQDRQEPAPEVSVSDSVLDPVQAKAKAAMQYASDENVIQAINETLAICDVHQLTEEKKEVDDVSDHQQVQQDMGVPQGPENVDDVPASSQQQ